MNAHLRADLPTVYLHPGELAICEKPTRVVTVLGSCVSVVIFNPATRLGAICHGTLPECGAKKACTSVCIEAFRYMDCSIHYMLARFHERGIVNDDIIVKLFGGADTLISKTSNSIGSRNIQIALEIMASEKLKITAEDVGDSFGRKLIFYSHTNEAFLKRLSSGNNNGGRYGR